MDRLTTLQKQLEANKTSKVSKPKSPNDVVICAAVRTPLTKSRKGALKDTSPEILLAHVLKNVIERAKVDPKLVDDVVVGNVLQSGAGQMQHRMACFLAGIPETSSVVSVNRLCSSGLEAVSQIAAKLIAG